MNKFLPPIEYFITIFICVTVITLVSIWAGWHFTLTKTYIENGFTREYNERQGLYFWVKPQEEVASEYEL